MANKIDLSGTHIPVLSKLLENTKGSVLELGSGFNSTPLLYWTCRAENRYFRSYENHKSWCDKLPEMTSYVKSWEDAKIDDILWDIAFIDCRPAHMRHKFAIRLKDKARFVVCHDTEPTERVYGYWIVEKYYKYRYNFTDLLPNTSVFSNFTNPSSFWGLDNK